MYAKICSIWTQVQTKLMFLQNSSVQSQFKKSVSNPALPLSPQWDKSNSCTFFLSCTTKSNILKFKKKFGGKNLEMLWNCRFEKNTKIPKCDFRNNSALLYMHTTSIFDLKVSFQRQFEGKPVSLGTEKFLPYHTFILLTYTYSTKPVCTKNAQRCIEQVWNCAVDTFQDFLIAWRIQT